MPEGDTIFRIAANLRKVLDGETIASATAKDEIPDADALSGSRVTGIESRGKHLIFHFSNGQALHSHMGMNGSWHLYRLTDPWQKSERLAAIVLRTQRWQAVCFTPRLIRLISERQLLRDDYLQRLGPDLLGPPISDEVFLARMRTQTAVPIGEVVMNQTVVSGIGNVYKSEVLFLEGLHPLTTLQILEDGVLLQLRDRVVQLLKQNLQNAFRRTRFRADGQKLWVYGRSGEICLRCGQTIQMLRQGDLGRSTYFCPQCQPER